MKKIILIIFLFLSCNVYASDYISSDNSFTLNMWFDSTNNDVYTNQWESFVTIDGSNSILNDLFVIEKDRFNPSCFDFRVDNYNTSVLYRNVCLEPGNHMLTISYGSSIDGNFPVIFYIDGVKQNIYMRWGSQAMSIEGVVILSDEIDSDSFVYSPNVLTSEQIQSLYDFGEPGTINYQVNLLFWEVIKHFRSFF